MKVLFTCGGTAGHINPALAVARHISTVLPEAEFLFIGAEGRMEIDLVPRAGYSIETVPITNIRRGFSLSDVKHNINTVKNVWTSVSEAKRIIRQFQPDVAIGTGGYVCYPVLKAAASLGIPTAIHESNAVPGLTTKMLEGVVSRIMVGFEESRSNYRRPERVFVTGTPVQADFINADKPASKRALGLPEDGLLVASVWGSLGAAHMNIIMTDFIVRLSANPFFSLIHSAGKMGFSRMCDALNSQWPEYRNNGIDVRAYIYDMPEVMAAADLILCRAGASTLAELTAMGKPAIIVPSPNVTSNHQEKNARVLEEAGGVKVLLESEFTADSLLGIVSELLHTQERLDEMSSCMKALGIPNATSRITEIVLELAMAK